MGKSTIIKNLIRHLSSSDPFGTHFSSLDLFDIPVTGSSSESHNSTSGGVHVYLDPRSFASDRPIIYTDSEGLRGGEPLANQLGAHSRPAHGRDRRDSSSTRAAVLHTVSRIRNSVAQTSSHHDTEVEAGLESSVTLPLPWTEELDLCQTWQSVVVNKIYPRFLYVFSDVVCYVSGNSRTAEEDIAHLIDWAHDAFISTTNQSVKPALLYIINQDNHAPLERWSKVEFATHTILEKLRSSNRFREEQEIWSDRGVVIDSVDQLLNCYYSTFKVMFIPQFLPTNPICEAAEVNDQYAALYDSISTFSWQASEDRLSAGILFDLETQSRHCMSVLEELSRDPNASVNLYHLAEPAREYPTSFKTHALNALSRLQEQSPKDRRTNHAAINSEVSLINSKLPYFAHCIAGEIERTKSDYGSPKEQLTRYEQRWRDVLDTFAKTHCRCEEMFKGFRCQNHGNSHVKGHQFNLRNYERVVMNGHFTSSFPATIDNLCNKLHALLTPLLNSRHQYDWNHMMWNSSKACGIDKLFSNRTCLTCLSRTPIQLLPCGHLVCDRCAGNLNVGPAADDSVLIIQQCPLGCSWNVDSALVRRKPKEAGVRILSLDGGGVRGIVELTILKAIMEKVGHNIPIQELFDVVVGTSTGGIVALGLFNSKWTIDDAITRFERLAKQAFSKRSGLRTLLHLPGGHITAQLLYSHLYKSSGIENALQFAFGAEPRLFGEYTSDPTTKRVIVVASGEEEQKAFLLTNYNREWRVNDDENNNLRREESAADELKVWEAARCTSAAPTYFQHYRHPATNRLYIDGAMEKNNPISIADSERKFIWPDKRENSRDIIVSVGAGYGTNYDGDPVIKRSSSALLRRFDNVGFVAKLAMLRLVLENTTNCQKMWTEFKYSLGSGRDPHDQHLLTKCHRVNVPYGRGLKICGLDAVDKMDGMKDEALAFLNGTSTSVSEEVQEASTSKIEAISRQLVASLFYFQQISHENYGDDDVLYKGLIKCRLSPACGASMRSLIQANPMFRIYEGVGPSPNDLTLHTGTWDLTSHSTTTEFRIPTTVQEVRIIISFNGGVSWDDISGFPRSLKPPSTLPMR
ncbi:hypothetical protein EG329_001890 [Mollisiaceae sp. DMI_Dod_QoI]|nr:hypothetical protein EG329_001890 [Helotiales sp. DMI_Dod_QoI]